MKRQIVLTEDEWRELQITVGEKFAEHVKRYGSLTKKKYGLRDLCCGIAARAFMEFGEDQGPRGQEVAP